MNEDLVFLTDYAIYNDLIEELLEEGTEIKEQDIDTDLLRVLRDNKIEYKIKLEEKWDDDLIIHKFHLVAEVYVNKIDYEKAVELLDSNQTIIDDVDELLNAEDIVDDESIYIDDENKTETEAKFEEKIEIKPVLQDNDNSDDTIRENQNHISLILSAILLLVLFSIAIYYLFIS